jgi:hypothetical protein
MFMADWKTRAATPRRWHPVVLVLAALLVAHGNAQSPNEGAISGTVLDTRGIPLADATISLIIEMGGCPTTVTTTDAKGRFRFSGAEPGRYRVGAAKIGYVTQQLD